MYKIYYGEKELRILSPSETSIANDSSGEKFMYAEKGLQTALEALNSKDIQRSILIAENKEAALNALKTSYSVYLAGGGLVHTPEGYMLLIFRRGKWDLPKGKLDKGEDIADCAIREVEEETGLTSPLLKEKLLVTYHTYSEKGKEILKESHWYRMLVLDKQDLQPQTEEDIELCEWVFINDLQRYKENMHPSVIDVLEEGLKFIKP